MLKNELRKIEAQKKEREKKTQDLQKLIALADSTGNKNETPTTSHKKSSKKKSSSSHGRGSGGDHHGGASLSSPGLRTPSTSKEIGAIDTAGIKFPDMRGAGVTLRCEIL